MRQKDVEVNEAGSIECYSRNSVAENAHDLVLYNSIVIHFAFDIPGPSIYLTKTLPLRILHLVDLCLPNLLLFLSRFPLLGAILDNHVAF
jgi:hypothetical protein